MYLFPGGPSMIPDRCTIRVDTRQTLLQHRHIRRRAADIRNHRIVESAEIARADKACSRPGQNGFYRP